MKPSYIVSSVEDLPKYPAIALTTATLELEVDGVKSKFSAFQWRKKALGDQDVEAVIFLSHGYAEYLTSHYEDFAAFLTENFNVAVIGHDHLGHGRSDGPRAQCLVDFEADYVVPLMDHIKHVNETIFGDKPVYIVGHSMGGLVSVLSLLKEPGMFRGAVLIGPLIEADPTVATPFMKGMAKLLGSVVPWLPLRGLDMKEVTRDEEEVEAMMTDGLRYIGGMKAKLGKALLAAMDTVDAAEIKTPTLVLLGEKDRICYPKGTKAFFEALASEDKEYKEYPEARHNLLMELAETKTAMFDDVQRWFGSRIG